MGDGAAGRVEVVAEYTLAVTGAQFVAEVLRLPDGSVRTRLSRGAAVGDVLTSEHVASLRVMLWHCLEAMCPLEGRRAA